MVTGIGDDAAVTALTPGMQLLTSTDMLLEDVHFRRSWHDPYRLGRKSLAASISDIASMGGIPRWSLLSLAIPADTPAGIPRRVHPRLSGHGRGARRGPDRRRYLLLEAWPGDLRHHHGGTDCPSCILRRSGARPGDDIWVTGTLGDAAMGLNLLECQPPLPQDHMGLTAEGWGEGN